MGTLRYAIVYMKGNIIDPSTPSFESFALLTYYYLLLYCFGNSWRISGINEYFNIINRSKNIKFCNFCVKTLYYEGLWRWWNVIYQLLETNIFQPKIFDITKSFSADNSYAFPKAIFHESQKSDHLHISSVYSTSNAQCILLAVQCFYLRGNKDPSALLSTRDKRVAITFQENQILNLGNHYHKYATQVALEILEKF